MSGRSESNLYAEEHLMKEEKTKHHFFGCEKGQLKSIMNNRNEKRKSWAERIEGELNRKPKRQFQCIFSYVGLLHF